MFAKSDNSCQLRANAILQKRQTNVNCAHKLKVLLKKLLSNVSFATLGIEELLTYLFGGYNQQVLASAKLRRHTTRAIAANFVVTFSVTCLAQRCRGRPFLRLQPAGSDSKTTNWVGAIHTSDMTQPSKMLYFKSQHHIIKPAI